VHVRVLSDWMKMMQSAAVLPGESAVKGLPDILGVPLQRKGFFFCLY